ncbi:hypothetical protein JHK87_031247 [Glycine soja]|nr:hypothetical protein JHK87_031247 [Glycine soja]
MGKNEMEIIGMTIMVMLIFVQADYCYASMKTQPDKLTCPAQCGIDCLVANIGYPICFAICVAKCRKTATIDKYDCITGCGVNKSITVNIDAHGFVSYVEDSCLQKCQNKS